MLILDTNIVSELVKIKPDLAVLNWISENYEQIYLTAISLQEIIYGVELMAHGKRKRHLIEKYERIFVKYFDNRTISLDQEAAIECAKLSAKSQKYGKTLQYMDAQIAGIVKSYQATLITRNTKDFIDLGIDILNPFSKHHHSIRHTQPTQ